MTTTVRLFTSFFSALLLAMSLMSPMEASAKRPVRCPEDPAAALEEACPCKDATRRSSYLRCVSTVGFRLLASKCLDRAARQSLFGCVAVSTCGRSDGAVTCCRERPGVCGETGVCVGADETVECDSDADCPPTDRRCRLIRSAERCEGLGGFVTTGGCCGECTTTTTTSTTTTTTTTTSTTSTTTTTSSTTTTTWVPVTLRTFARGSIIAPGGVPQQVNPCGIEIVAAGSDWWGNGCWNQVRGIMEFDLRGLPAGGLSRATLRLQDSGATGVSPQIIEIFGYPADGQLTLADWDQAASHLMTISRPDSAGTTLHDVTSFVAACMSAGDAFVGFRYEPGAASTLDAFGFWGELVLE